MNGTLTTRSLVGTYVICCKFKLIKLYCEHINGGFLAALGPPFLALLYEAIDQGEDSALIVKEVDGNVVGFVSGAASLRPIFKRLLFRPFSLFISLLSFFYLYLNY